MHKGNRISFSSIFRTAAPKIHSGQRNRLTTTPLHELLLTAANAEILIFLNFTHFIFGGIVHNNNENEPERNGRSMRARTTARSVCVRVNAFAIRIHSKRIGFFAFSFASERDECESSECVRRRRDVNENLFDFPQYL